jgi:hypothetical protein
MKSAQDNSALDIFIRKTLQVPGENLTPVDWSELEVLLRNEQKSIPLEINKKTIVYSAAGAIALILLFSIFKIVHHYSSLPPEPETPASASIDTLKPTAADSSVSNPAPAPMDTSHVAINSEKPNSVTSTIVHADTIGKKAAAVQKLDKKHKQNNGTDTSAIKKDTVLQPISDTAATHPIQEIKQEIKTEIPVAVDTSNKNPVAPKNNSKSKKGKSKKTSASPPAEQPQSVPPAEIKSDSLKQQ